MEPSGTGSVSEAWKRKDNRADEPGSRPVANVERPSRSGPSPYSTPDPIATVNGQSIARQLVVDLLLGSRGPSALEQFIVMEAAERAVVSRGLSVTPAEMRQEYDLSLQRLSNALPSIAPSVADSQEAERFLDTVLLERQSSRAEFSLGIRRNAFLRKLAAEEVAFTDDELRAEFNRTYGPRVQVRHIQLATTADVARVREQLAAGADFADLARKISANSGSAASGGLLRPFAADDETVPALLRQTAFGLPSDSVSDAVRIGPWYHILKIERTLPAEPRDLAQVRPQLEEALRTRRCDAAMQRLYEKLFQEADIRIHDPVLKESFDARFPDRSR